MALLGLGFGFLEVGVEVVGVEVEGFVEPVYDGGGVGTGRAPGIVPGIAVELGVLHGDHVGDVGVFGVGGVEFLELFKAC